MKPIEVSQHVAAPPERVFAAASDFAGAAQRIEAIKAVEMLTEGPLRVGTRFKETRVMFGREASEVMWVTELDTPRRYVLGAESCGTRYRTELLFTPKDGGTEVTMRFAGEPLTFVAKLMSVVFAPMMKGLAKMCAKDLKDLATAVESGR